MNEASQKPVPDSLRTRNLNPVGVGTRTTVRYFQVTVLPILKRCKLSTLHPVFSRLCKTYGAHMGARTCQNTSFLQPVTRENVRIEHVKFTGADGRLVADGRRWREKCMPRVGGWGAHTFGRSDFTALL